MAIVPGSGGLRAELRVLVRFVSESLQSDGAQEFSAFTSPNLPSISWRKTFQFTSVKLAQLFNSWPEIPGQHISSA